MRAELIRGAGLRGGRDCDESGTARTAGLPGERDCERAGCEKGVRIRTRRGAAVPPPRAFHFRALPSPFRSPRRSGFLAVPDSSQFRFPRSSALLAVPASSQSRSERSASMNGAVPAVQKSFGWNSSKDPFTS